MSGFPDILFCMISVRGEEKDVLPRMNDDDEEDSKMILDTEKSFESVLEIYGGFPLKENFLDAGNAVLAQYDLQAEYEDGVIRIPYVARPYYTAEELEEYLEEGIDEEYIPQMKQSVLYAEIVIDAEDSKSGITDVGFECRAEGEAAEDDPEIIEDHLTEKEWDLQIELIEAFLNAAVDAG